MKFLSLFLMFGGYMLVYAATANGGRFATEPWEGLFADAYDAPTTGSANPSSPGAPSTPRTPPSSPQPSSPSGGSSGGGGGGGFNPGDILKGLAFPFSGGILSLPGIPSPLDLLP